MDSTNLRIDLTPRELLNLKIDPSILIDFLDDILENHTDNTGVNWLNRSSIHLQLAIDYIKAFNKEIEIIRREELKKMKQPF